MKTLSQLLLALVLCSACPSTSFGQAVQTQRSSITDAELDARVNDYVQPYVQMNDFSGVVFIEKQNKIRVNRSYGSSNYELNAPIDSRTKFRIASISKQFTAASIMLLQERGKLSLADHLDKFIPDFPKGDKITLSMLLSHKAGISRDLSNEGGQLRVQRTIGDLINIIKIQPLIGKPGEKESYSNNGYRILAFVIEKVSGKSLKDFLRENFFTPLGMKDTGEDEQIDLVAERANGYVRWIGGSLANVPFYDMSNNIGAAGLYSSAEDLFRWDVSLYEAKILKRSSVDLMIKEDYGIGERKTRHRSVGHDGRLTGFTSFNDCYPDDDTCIIVLSNIESGAITNMRADLPSIVFGEPYNTPVKRPDPIKLDAKIIEPYLGRYEVFPGLVLTTRKEQGALLLGAGEGFYPLVPESEARFFYPLRYAEVEFIKDPGGAVTSLKWREFGSEFVCKKIE